MDERVWLMVEISKGDIHIAPEEDIKEHEYVLTCWCCPRYDEFEEGQIIHNCFLEKYGDDRDIC